MTKPKRRWGDRIDGRLVRDSDPMHFFVPYLYPNRADSEAVVEEEVDLTALEAYLEKKNAGREKDDHYTLMHAVATALVRTLTLRPKMNYFIKGNRIYERNHISLAFVVKKKFADNGAEALAYRKFGPETTIDTLHRMLVEEIQNCRSDALDNSTAGMEMFTHLPRWLMRIAIRILFFLDYYGKVPQFLVKADPNSRLGADFQSGLDQAQRQLPPPVQLGHELDLRRHRQEPQGARVQRRRQLRDAPRGRPERHPRRAHRGRLLLFQIHRTVQAPSAASRAAGRTSGQRG